MPMFLGVIGPNVINASMPSGARIVLQDLILDVVWVLKALCVDLVRRAIVRRHWVDAKSAAFQ